MPDRDQGFSLLETIVALAIIGLVATAVFDLLIGPGMRRAKDAEQLERLMSARALLASVQARPPAGPIENKVTLASGTILTLRLRIDDESPLLYRAEVFAPGHDGAVLATLIRRPRQ